MKKKCFFSAGFCISLLLMGVTSVSADQISSASSEIKETNTTIPSSEISQETNTSFSTSDSSSLSETNRSEYTSPDSQSESSTTQSDSTINFDSSSRNYEIPSGRSDLYESSNGNSRNRSARAAILSPPTVKIDDVNTPKKDFIDVSSHNGNISVQDYEMMKQYGVKGVVVKLTEYTTYRNPYAKAQVKNAQQAGLKVSVYHYSWFTSEAEAIAEANYFADFAQELQLPKSTLMVNDIEEPKIANQGDHTQNSIAFKKRLNELGFSNVIHYSGLYWITQGLIDASTLGEKNIWVAAYPYTLSTTQLYSNYSAWQWSSLVNFPNMGTSFDMSSDYLGVFTNKATDNIDLTKYYTDNPGFIIMKKEDYIYSNVSFGTLNRKRKVNKNQVIAIKGIAYDNKTPRLITDDGYLTANKSYVQKILSSYKNYMYTLPKSGYIYTKKDDYSYSNTSFTNRKVKYAKGSVLKVKGIAFASDGCPRLLLSDGTYFTANLNRVSMLTASYNSYLIDKPQYVLLKKDDYIYQDVNFKNRGTKIKKNQVIKVNDITFTSSGVPRLKVSNGYVTSNKKYVAKLISSYQNYYYKDVKKIEMLKNDYYYSSVNFKTKNRKRKVSKGTVVTVQGVELDNNGTPRFKTSQGYISAKKTIVKVK
ncbi:DUF5776 domain-containing protein [Enterococcus gallinarum]|uniref:DUF5776 domain-containing protein n=1 Tax=Enterococcus gallinarum TaxID=1353 RepID=UPI0028913E4D|nr:DUF5776 domain-containing protein [Enterococcus gallinarum]MDT2696467.1 DUF5776 domain-containing protein [Enterococcus gallinarum]